MTTETKPAHTPLPWTANGATIKADVFRIARIETKANVAPCHAAERRPIMQEESDANAALIVRAVNCHAELVELVSVALPYVEEEAKKPAYKPGVVNKLIARMVAALAKAEAAT